MSNQPKPTGVEIPIPTTFPQPKPTGEWTPLQGDDTVLDLGIYGKLCLGKNHATKVADAHNATLDAAVAEALEKERSRLYQPCETPFDVQQAIATATKPLVDALTEIERLTERVDACHSIDQISVSRACTLAKTALAQAQSYPLPDRRTK